MRVVIASRIFAPEPAAASFRLAALASALADEGFDVEVLTARLPRGGPSDASSDERIRIKRSPVLRDARGAVRGYLPYLSFDLPLIGRVLTTPRADAYVVEPPPTTGLAVMVAAALRRRPFVYYAADVLSDAAGSAGSPRIVVTAVRWMERVVWRRATRVLSVSPSVTTRLRQLGVPAGKIAQVGNGVDVKVFRADGPTVSSTTPYVLYAGTASEVHGAAVFIDALADVHGVRMVFVGSGSEIEALRERAREVAPGRVDFYPTTSAKDVARWLRGAAVAVASVKPTGGYEFAFPTKLYAAAACGTPVLFSGDGPGLEFARSLPLGRAVAHDSTMVARAIEELVALRSTESERLAQAKVAAEVVDLEVVARGAASVVAHVAEQVPANRPAVLD